ncbi:hypothetical protein [Streptosporangium saharense]|uniref:Uncharacterized protein n=1 Tax=Streptosporangium saharense TaxID=1706840 RepID=A0A7W7QXH9_9ACTN|nr:hypothetical protein [Streptosporangium saharense]MBB4920966.1 hypothetical protein [Streptosporangium saharense]
MNTPDPGRMARLDLATVLAAQVDASRHQRPLTLALTWAEGDAMAQLLEQLARELPGEPIAELAQELAGQLQAQLGPAAGPTPEEQIAAMTRYHTGA